MQPRERAVACSYLLNSLPRRAALGNPSVPAESKPLSKALAIDLRNLAHAQLASKSGL
jgi:hypothetical protein